MRKLAPKMANRLGVIPHSEILNRIAVNAIPLTSIVTTERASKITRLQEFPKSLAVSAKENKMMAMTPSNNKLKTNKKFRSL